MSITIATLKALLTLDTSDFTSSASSAHATTDKLKGNLESFGKVGMVALGGAATAAAGLLGYGVKIAADMETARIGFVTMLGSAEKADSFLRDLQAFAAKTPFEFPELQTAASSLISIGIDASKVIPIMTTLGNVTSGMGTGAEGVKRATVALQQMNAAGKITAEDLNQLRDAGIPVFDLLAAATGKTKQQIAEMAQAGKLGRKELEQLMAALESGKGLERFNGLMEEQSKSFTGMVSTLKDTVGMQLATLAGPLMEGLKKAMPVITDFIDRGIKAITPPLQEASKAVGEFFMTLTTGLTENDVATPVEELARSIRGAFEWLLDHKELIIGTVTAIGVTWAAAMAMAAIETIAATWPLIALIGALSLAIAAGVWVWNNYKDQVIAAWDAIRPKVLEVWNNVFVPFWEFMKNSWPTVWEKAQQYWQDLQPVLDVLKSAVMQLWENALRPALQFISDNQDMLKNFAVVLGVIAAVIGGALVLAMATMAAMFVAAEAAMAGVVFGIVLFITALMKVVQVVWDVFNNVRDALGGAIEAVENFVGAIPEKLGAAVDAIEGFFLALPGMIWGAIQAIPGLIGQVFDTALVTLGFFVGLMVQAAFNLVTGIWNALLALPGIVWGIFIAAKDFAVNTVSALVAAVVDFFIQLPGRAAGAVSFLWGAISGAFFSAKDQATSTAAATSEGVLDWLRQLPGRAAGALAGFAGTVRDGLFGAVGAAISVGGDIVRGIASGITGAVGWVRDAAVRAAGDIISGFKAALHIGSPSRVMALEVGRWIPAGVAAGIESGMAGLRAATADMMDIATAPMPGHPRVTHSAASRAPVVAFTGNTSDAFASAFMRLVREGKIQIEAA